jgi:hypothetical protein
MIEVTTTPTGEVLDYPEEEGVTPPAITNQGCPVINDDETKKRPQVLERNKELQIFIKLNMIIKLLFVSTYL